MLHVPRFDYDSVSTLTLTWPAMPYTPVHGSIGGARWSAAGTGASYSVRRDRDLRLTVRVEETELDDVETLIEWAQGLEEFDWFPDADEEDSVGVFLAGPQLGEEWTPRRDAQYPSVWLVDLTLRKADGTRFDASYFTEAAS
jgi:hypothetical protein